MAGINPFARSKAPEPIPEVVTTTKILPGRYLMFDLIGKVLGGQVARLPMPIESQQASKRRIRRLRGKAKEVSRMLRGQMK